MIDFIKVFLLFCFCGLGYSWQDVRNADQSLWAFRTCQRRSSNVDLVKKWMAYVLPDDKETHCYVMCAWSLLGAYSEEAKAFNINGITKQFKERGMNVPKEVQIFGGRTDGCKAVYDKTVKVFKTQLQNFRNAFYGTKESSDEWFKANPNTKPKGTKISTFCEAKGIGDCIHSCSFYYYRLIDEDNLIIPFSYLPGYPETKLKECRRQVQDLAGCKSDALFLCLKNADKAALEASLKQLDDQSKVY
uniref:LolD7 n=1 Tax=Bichromomyia olmeca TaxID=715919 RepID=A0A1B1V3H6_9DIPT|nr:LolD7 [Bichromomyia olmeca]